MGFLKPFMRTLWDPGMMYLPRDLEASQGISSTNNVEANLYQLHYSLT